VSYVSGQGSSLVICVGILTSYTDTLYKMLLQLSGVTHKLRLCCFEMYCLATLIELLVQAGKDNDNPY